MVTEPFLPYGRQGITEADIEAVVKVLRSDWLTTGPVVEHFEAAVAAFVGISNAVAVSSGTAALHAAMYAIAIGPGDEVIVPPLTFSATANAVVYQGGVPVFADVDADTLLIDPDAVEAKITRRTKAIVAVDYAGQPADYHSLRTIADRHNLFLVADACHSLGAKDGAQACGSLADLSAFSFHPVKPITTGEGGMVTTDDPEMAERMRIFRNHGITTNHYQRQQSGNWFYEMVDLGFNYRLSDIQCALGLAQLQRLPDMIARRQEIAAAYDEIFRGTTISPLRVRPDVSHGYHLYVVRLPERDRQFAVMRDAGIGVNLHYIPVHLHPFYRQRFGTEPGMCPVAEKAFTEILSLPIFPAMTDRDVKRVRDTLETVGCYEGEPCLRKE